MAHMGVAVAVSGIIYPLTAYFDAIHSASLLVLAAGLQAVLTVNVCCSILWQGCKHRRRATTNNLPKQDRHSQGRWTHGPACCS